MAWMLELWHGAKEKEAKLKIFERALLPTKSLFIADRKCFG